MVPHKSYLLGMHLRRGSISYVFAHRPITEAVLDLRVNELDVELPNLLEVLKALPEFQEIKELHHVTGELELRLEDKTATAQASRRILGFAASNTERTRVLQVRKNGFALSHFAPYQTLYQTLYQNCEALETEARQYWNLFREVLSPSVIRMATRYTHRFDLPSSDRLDFADSWIREA